MNTEQPTEETLCSANTCSASTPERGDSKTAALKRTPFTKFKRVHSNFKSPVQVTDGAKVSPAEEVAELERRREQLDTEIAQLEAEGCRVEELEHHIDMLHEYNDIKDIGQSLLGRIDIAAIAYVTLRNTDFEDALQPVTRWQQSAALRGTTTRDLYSHFGLELDD